MGRKPEKSVAKPGVIVILPNCLHCDLAYCASHSPFSGELSQRVHTEAWASGVGNVHLPLRAYWKLAILHGGKQS